MLMKYAVIPEVRKIQIRQKPLPLVYEDRVLIKVNLCGICGTDIQIYQGKFPASLPYTPGHEYSGEVVDLGEKTEGIRVGDRVVVNPNFSCGTCYYCTRGFPNHCLDRKKKGLKSNGGFAEYCAVPLQLVFPLPTTISNRESVLVEPLSCALHAVEEAAVEPGDAVVIIGCGTMGLLSLALCRKAGGRPIIAGDPVQAKRELAKKMGADFVLDPTKDALSSIVLDVTRHGAAVVIDNVGISPTIEEGLRSLQKGGTFILAGINTDARQIPMSPSEITARGLKIRGVFLNPSTFSKALQVMPDIGIDCSSLIAKEFPLADIEKAFKATQSKEAVKIVVNPVSKE